MLATNVLLIISGIFCLLLGGFIFFKVKPQEGQPPSEWTNSDWRGNAMAMGLLLLLLAGASLLVKGIFS